MAAFDSYQDLIATVNTWLDRSEQTAAFITLAESRLNKRLRTRFQETNASLTSTDGVAPLPADYLEWRQVTLSGNPRTALAYVTPEYAATRWAAWPAGESRCFTIVGSDLQTFPMAQAAVLFDYYAAIPALSDAAPTNWLLLRYPDIYLYATLVEAFGLIRLPRLERFGSAYELAVSDIEKADRSARWARGGARISGKTP